MPICSRAYRGPRNTDATLARVAGGLLLVCSVSCEAEASCGAGTLTVSTACSKDDRATCLGCPADSIEQD